LGIRFNCEGVHRDLSATVDAHGQFQLFRVASKNVLLTYSALQTNELTKERVVEELRAKCSGGMREHMVGDEIHPAPANPLRAHHIHALIGAEDRWDTQDETYFDLNGEAGRVLHPYIQSMGPTEEDRQRVLRYIIKDGNYTCDLKSPITLEAMANKKNGWGEAVRDAKDVEEAEAALREDYPDVLYDKGDRVLQRKAEEDVSNESVGSFEMDAFKWEPLDLTKKAVVVRGPSGIGKTQFCLAHGKHPLLISALDDLKMITSKTDLLVFDDNDLSDKSPEFVIALLDMETARSIKLRYKNARIRKGMKRMLTTNKKAKKMFPRPPKKQKKALRRRYDVFTFRTQMY
jgi:hypothetical protein